MNEHVCPCALCTMHHVSCCVQVNDPGMVDEEDGDQGPKNIRRRVYDALNVLIALNVMAKNKKDIRYGCLCSCCAAHPA